MDAALLEAKRKFLAMIEKAQSPSARWLNAVEAEIEQDGREVKHELLQGAINSMGIGDIGPMLLSGEGIGLSRRRVTETLLHTIHGKITIRRMGYSLPGHESIFPLDAAINLPSSSFSFELQRLIARRVSTTAFDEVLALTKEVTGVKIGKRQATEIVQQSAIDFDGFYENQRKISGSNKAPIMVLTTDGKGIIMRPEGLREETRKRAAKTTPKMRTRLARGEKTNRKRMAQVASIYLIPRFCRTPKDVIDELARREARKHRPRPINKRIWASVEKEADAVIGMMFAEARKRDPKHKKEWVILVDGHKQQLRLIKGRVKREGVDAAIILDIIHVIEYLWIAARVFNEEESSSECERWVEDKLEMILNSHAGKVAGSIRMSASKASLTDAQKKSAEKCARYIARRKPYMQYARYLERGYPIATGVIEGACRYLIKDRMDVTGARWSLKGAEAVLKLRSLVKSGDFEAYWPHHVRCEYERSHASKLGDITQLEPLFRKTPS